MKDYQLGDQNQWWIDKENISNDSKIQDLENSKIKWYPNLKNHLKMDHDAIYTIRGPRQVGKTTMMKMIIRELLQKKIEPENIFFWSFERNNNKELHEIMQAYLDSRIGNKNRKYLFLDEICSVKNWSKELIYFANKGDLKNCSMLLTGDNSMDLKHSTERMPGRRGGLENEPLDKILLPMKFSEFVKLQSPELFQSIERMGILKKEIKHKMIKELFEGKIDRYFEKLMLRRKEFDVLFDKYLLTGGIPSAINQLEQKKELSQNNYIIYLNAIIGDLRKGGYKENYFKQLIRELFTKLSSPISWNAFTKMTDIKSHSTVQEYATALEEFYIANMCLRISIHDKKIHTFNKKIYIQDPFIFHALNGWSNGKNFFTNAKENLLNSEVKSKIVEGVVHDHVCRFAYDLNPRDLFDPKDFVFYYQDKNKKEVDFVLLFEDKYYPFELKYQEKISPSDFSCFKSFNKGVLITKKEIGIHRNYVKIPITLLLFLI